MSAHSLPQFESFAHVARDFGMTAGVQAGRDRLRTEQWCTMGRALPYGEGSQSTLLEVFLIVAADADVAFFSACPRTGRIVDGHGRSEAGEPSRRVAGGGILCGKHQRRISDSPPLIAFHCLNHTKKGSQVLSGFRFRIELHVNAESQNKRDLQKYMQEHHTAMHPAILPDYFKALVAAAKKAGDDQPGPAKFRPVTNKFTRAIFAYHAAVEQALRPRGASLADFPDLLAAIAASSADERAAAEAVAAAEARHRMDNPLDGLAPSAAAAAAAAGGQFGFGGSTVHAAVPAGDPVAGFPVSTAVVGGGVAAAEAAVAAVDRMENPLGALEQATVDAAASAAAGEADAAAGTRDGLEFIDDLFAAHPAVEAPAPKPWAIPSVPPAAASQPEETVSCSSASAFGTPVSEGLPPMTMSAAAAVPAAEAWRSGSSSSNAVRGGGMSLIDELFATPEVTAAAQSSQRKKQEQQAPWESFSDAPFQS